MDGLTSEWTTVQWATLGLGALVSWLFLSWISQPKTLKFHVNPPAGN